MDTDFLGTRPALGSPGRDENHCPDPVSFFGLHRLGGLRILSIDNDRIAAAEPCVHALR